MSLADRATLFRQSVLAGAVAVASAGASLAQAQENVALEEIIITATKRLETIQEVPIAVTAFDNQQMQDMSLRTVGDTMDFTPNVSRSSGPSSGTDGFFFFRGVGQTDNNINVDPGVAVYMDQVYLGRLQGASFNLIDVERIEILRGPQGTFFGRNTVGGAVNITTKDPTGNWGGEGRVTLGQRDRADVYGAVDMPLGDAVRARMSLYTRNQEGWVESVYTGDTYGDEEEVGGRLKMMWDATDELTVTLVGDWADNDGTQLPSVLLEGNPMAGFIPQGAVAEAGDFGPGNPPFDIPSLTIQPGGPTGVAFPTDSAGRHLFADVDDDPFDDDGYFDSPALADTERGGATGIVAWSGEDIELKSITGYRIVEQAVNTDLDGTGYAFYNSLFEVDQEQLSQEFQVSGYSMDDRLNWLVGAYYFDEEVEGVTDLCVGTGSEAFLTMAPPPAPPVGEGAPIPRNDSRCMLFSNGIDLDVKAFALFGQADYDITDALTLILGFRYTDEEKDQVFDAFTDNTDSVFSQFYLDPVFSADLPMPGGIAYSVSPDNPSLTVPFAYNDTWEEVSPKLGLEYEVNLNLSTYITWSNGFKSGGFGGRATPEKPMESYDPETNESWEVGVKSDWLDHRLRVNGALFYTFYDDIQLLVNDAPSGAPPQFITVNGGDNEVQGVELEVWALPIPDLQLTAGIGWLDTEWKELDPRSADLGLSKSDPLPNTPEWTIALGAEYTVHLNNAGALSFRADYSFNDEMSYTPEADANDIQEDYEVVNVRMTYLSPDERWNVALYGLNVFEEEYFLQKSDNLASLGTATAIPAPPAEWGVEAHYRF